MLILIKGKKMFQKRSEIESHIFSSGGRGTYGMTEEKLDKLKYLERKSGVPWIDTACVDKATRSVRSKKARNVI
jgi:hypothetical protein